MLLKKLTDGRFIVKLKKRYTEKQFLQFSRAEKGSYAEEFSMAMYRTIFCGADDVKHEFQEYYSDEYDSINDFLFWRYYLSKDIIDELNIDSGDEFIGIINKYVSFFQDENLIINSLSDLLEQIEKFA